jgi:hypothetical protein
VRDPEARAKEVCLLLHGHRTSRLWISPSWSLEPHSVKVPGVKALGDIMTCRLDEKLIRNSEPCSEPSSCVVVLNLMAASPVSLGATSTTAASVLPHQRLWHAVASSAEATVPRPVHSSLHSGELPGQRAKRSWPRGTKV